jgi:hypothetical protein
MSGDMNKTAEHRISRRVLFGAILVVVVATAGVLSQLGLGGSERVRIATGSVSALARAAQPADSLPASILAYPFAARNFASPSGAGARLLTTQDALRLYAVPGKGGMLCLVEVDSAAQTSGGACAERSILLTGSIYMADRQEDGSRQVVGLVGDGPTYAEANGRRTRVENNAFVLRGVRGDEVTVGSPTASQTVEIGG